MGEGFTIVNPDRNLIGLIAAKAGLKALRDTGMKLNRAYSLKNCRAIVERETGQTFKPRDYDGMIAAAEKTITETKAARTMQLGEHGVPTND